MLLAESGDDLDGLVLAAGALERREEALAPLVWYGMVAYSMEWSYGMITW